MNKKKQNKKTSNPRRTKGRVYQIPTVLEKDPTAFYKALEAELPNKSPTESICDKARRLANEAEETKKKERAERELAFMKRMFETEDLAGAGVVMDKVREDGTIEYLICGRRWKYFEKEIPFSSSFHGCLINLDRYMGFSLDYWPLSRVNNLGDLGKLLRYMDGRETELRAKYPDNWWGRLKAKWA